MSNVRPPQVTESLRPLWIEFPRIPWGSIGWRMGGGEDYWLAWSAWFKSLPGSEQEAYAKAWPEPTGWEGLYAFVRTGTVPPSVSERRAHMDAAAIPIEPGETEINNYYRVVWLIRNQLKEVSHEHPTEEEWDAWRYHAPDGSAWRVSSSKANGLRLLRLKPSNGA